MDNSDYYALNGQRLIVKSGFSNGANAAEYETEKYSNVKIKSVGSVTSGYTGPEYFEVTFEDGSQAWYGSSANSRTPIEYNISKWKDAQGNYITYNYTLTNNVAVISSIQWGGNETLGKAHFNKITFNYITRDFKENSYVAGLLLLQDKILSNVVVEANGAQFKKYEITYKTDGNGSKYQFVDKITEKNADNEAANPVEFGYEESTNSNTWEDFTISTNLNAELKNRGSNLGDIDGDGKLDLVYGDGTGYGNAKILYNVFEKNGTVATIPYPQHFKGKLGNMPVTYSDSLGHVSSNQGIMGYEIGNAVKKMIRDESSILEYSTKRDLTVNVFSIENNTLIKKLSKKINADDWDRTYFVRRSSGNLFEVQTVNSGIGKERVMDLNGDGFSELILEIVHNYYTQNNYLGSVIENRHEEKEYLVIFPNSIQSYEKLALSANIEREFEGLYQGDFDGDGRYEFLSMYGGQPQLTKYLDNYITSTFKLHK